MYACMTPVGFDTSDKFENHCIIVLCEDWESAVPLVTAFMDFALAVFAVLPNFFELSARYYRDQ